MSHSIRLPRRPRIVLSADQLGEKYIATIGASLEAWADWRCVPQNSPDDQLAAEITAADVVVGWAPTPLLRDGKTSVYLCGSNGIDAYVGHGLGTKENFQLCNAGDIMSVPIAEHCFAMMLAAARELPTIFRQQAGKHWERRWFARELNGDTVCIVGLGGSGSALAQRCRAFGMRVIGVRRNTKKPVDGVDVIYPPDALGEAVAEADHVAVALPGGPTTRHTFNDAIFERMKPTAWFYSISRGSVTDEEALCRALTSGKIAGAGLDVYETEPLPLSSPLWQMPNVIVSPHSAGLSDRLSDRLTALFIDNLDRLRRGEPLLNRIDLRELEAQLA